MEISPPGVCLVAFRRGFPAVCVRVAARDSNARLGLNARMAYRLARQGCFPAAIGVPARGRTYARPEAQVCPPRWHRSAPGGSRGISLAGIPDKNLFDFCSGLFREFFSRMFFRFREEDSGLSDERSREERPERDSKETWLNCLNAKFKQVLNIRCVSL